jgi:hypothetical protein
MKTVFDPLDSLQADIPLQENCENLNIQELSQNSEGTRIEEEDNDNTILLNGLVERAYCLIM